MRWPGARCGT
uniref:Uncharacterized protein n=1 Tax=Arundo donax TaxID=35708 RepID=A0A0A8Y4L3_ARUDO